MAIGQTALAFGLVYIIVRILGKNEVSQGTFWNFVSAIVLGSLGAQLATTGITGLPSIIAVVTTWGFLSFTTSYVGLKHRGVRGVLEGKPTVIIHNGKILEDQLARVRYTLDQLLADLRLKQVASITDVEFAILETSGQLSLILKSQKRPVTPADLKLPTTYTGLATELILDGQLIRQNLSQVNLTEEWLMGELQRRGVADLSEVVLATLDTAGRLYIDLRRDDLKNAHRPGDLPH
jgi:uncharacterized membrane protein YcaP (DUF421 family)